MLVSLESMKRDIVLWLVQGVTFVHQEATLLLDRGANRGVISQVVMQGGRAAFRSASNYQIRNHDHGIHTEMELIQSTDRDTYSFRSKCTQAALNKVIGEPKHSDVCQ